MSFAHTNSCAISTIFKSSSHDAKRRSFSQLWLKSLEPPATILWVAGFDQVVAAHQLYSSEHPLHPRQWPVPHQIHSEVVWRQHCRVILAALPKIIRQSHRKRSVRNCRNSFVWGFPVAARMSKSSALQICWKLSVQNLSAIFLVIMSRNAYQVSALWYEKTSVYWCAGPPSSKRLGICDVEAFPTAVTSDVRLYDLTSFQIVMNCLSHLMDAKESTTWETLYLAPDNVIDLIWSTVASCSTTENTLYAAVKHTRLSNDRSLYNKPSALAPAGPDSSERLSSASTTDSFTISILLSVDD